MSEVKLLAQWLQKQGFFFDVPKWVSLLSPTMAAGFLSAIIKQIICPFTHGEYVT